MNYGYNNFTLPQINPYQDRLNRYMDLTNQQIQQPQQQNNNTNMNFLVVENIDKAKQQIVPYGYTMWMRDTNLPYQYVKSVDTTGQPTFKVLKIVDVTDEFDNNNENINYVSINEFNSLNQKVEQLQSTINYYSQLLKPTEEVKKTRGSKDKVGDNNE